MPPPVCINSPESDRRKGNLTFQTPCIPPAILGPPSESVYFPDSRDKRATPKPPTAEKLAGMTAGSSGEQIGAEGAGAKPRKQRHSRRRQRSASSTRRLYRKTNREGMGWRAVHVSTVDDHGQVCTSSSHFLLRTVLYVSTSLFLDRAKRCHFLAG